MGAIFGYCARERVKMTSMMHNNHLKKQAIAWIIKKFLLFIEIKCSLSYSRNTAIKFQVKSSYDLSYTIIRAKIMSLN